MSFQDVVETASMQPLEGPAPSPTMEPTAADDDGDFFANVWEGGTDWFASLNTAQLASAYLLHTFINPLDGTTNYANSHTLLS